MPPPGWGWTPDQAERKKMLKILGVSLLSALGLGAATGGAYALRSNGIKDVPGYRRRPELDPILLSSPVKEAATYQPPPGIGASLTSRVGGVPNYTWPAAALASLPVLLGTNAIIANYVNKRRRRKLDEELQAAKDEYESALTDSPVPSMPSVKSGSATTALDRLFDLVVRVKSAAAPTPPASPTPPPPPTTFQQGAAPTVAALLAVLGAYGTYKYLNERDSRKLYGDAIKRRELIRNTAQPPEVYFNLPDTD